MNPRLCIICVAALLALGTPALAEVPFLADSNITATVHGATYAWDTLETINNTVIEVNSTPPQSIVAKDGTYSFDLVSGDYAITASYYRNDTLVYSRETTLRIEEEGNYVLDLLLYPVSESRIETISTRKNQNSMSPARKTRTGFSVIGYLPVILTLFFLLGGIYQLSKKHKKNGEKKDHERKLSASGLLVKAFNKITYSGVKSDFRTSGKAAFVSESVTEHGNNYTIETASLKKQPVPPELSEILNIIRGNKGRITQKDLRGRLKYSEVKVSLMLSELEKRGLIKKFKNGRENIVVLIEEEP